jgi:hypothetical protein
MKNKATPPTMQTFRAQISITFDAPDWATAQKRAKEMFGDSPNTAIRLQQQSVAWTTIPDSTAPTS